MSVTTSLIKKVCAELKILCHELSDNEALLQLSLPTGPHLILNACLGVNSDAESRLTKDKFYCHQFLSGTSPLPKTISYVDPDTFGYFRPYITFTSLSEIVTDLKHHFSFPVIIKRNSGTQGQNVFLCQSDGDAISAFEHIYSKAQLEYDHIALVQEYIRPSKEYRVIIYRGQIELAYLKDISNAQYTGNLSPLHWQSATTKVVTDTELIYIIQRIVTDLYKIFPITYAGLDIIEDNLGQLWLIEINSTPQFGEFLKSNPSIYVENIYRKILTDLSESDKLPIHFPSALQSSSGQSHPVQE